MSTQGPSADLRARAAEYRRQGAELSRAAVNRQRANFALNAGNQLFFRNKTDKLLLRAATAFERRHDARESRDLDKVTPFHKVP